MRLYTCVVALNLPSPPPPKKKKKKKKEKKKNTKW